MFEITPNPNGKVVTVASLMKQETVQERFQSVLGKRAAAFMSSVLTLSSTNYAISHCDPVTILASAMMAAVLDLPIENNLGFAYIVPYKTRDGDKAQFQIGYKGLTQLALRSGQYETIHTGVILEGQVVNENPITGEISVTGTAEVGAKSIGYIAYLKLTNGFEKSHYMTREQIEEHAKKYSKSWGNQSSAWSTSFDAMARKTVLRYLLTHYGIMSIEMQKSITSEDQESAVEVNNWVDVRGNAAATAQLESGKPSVNNNEPMGPEEVQNWLVGAVKEIGAYKPSPEQTGLMVSMMELAFAPDKDADKIRRSCLRFLWGVDSSKKMSGPQIKATLDWLAPTKDSGGAYSPEPRAAQELHAIWTASLEAAGQSKLL